MNERVHENFDELLAAEPRGELVHWMEARPLSVGAGGLSLAVAGAFAAGLTVGLLLLGLSQAIRRERRMSVPLERKLRRLS